MLKKRLLEARTAENSKGESGREQVSIRTFLCSLKEAGAEEKIDTSTSCITVCSWAHPHLTYSYYR